MARPRIFVSSTYYDLKHLRSSLENFIESLGFEPILSEKGDIAYAPDASLDNSCYRDASSADIFVLIIGGRYGSVASVENKKPSRTFFERYDSITKLEYRHAVSNDVPAYILIEANVYSEFRTFLENKGNKDINYAHIDSVNIFYLIEDILSQPKNNPVFSFDRYSEVEEWLREQWAGLFKELLRRLSGQQHLATLSSKISELGEINVTLRRYMETLITKISPKESEEIIESEGKRLEEAQKLVALKKNLWVRHVTSFNISLASCVAALQKAKSYNQFVDIIESSRVEDEYAILPDMIRRDLRESPEARRDYNEARKILGLKPLKENKTNQ